MPIIVNGITLPTNGDYLQVNGVPVDTVIANGVTVWQKQKAEPFYIVNNFMTQGSYATDITWTMTNQINVSRISQWRTGSYGATITGTQVYEDQNSEFWASTNAINTKGNHTLLINAKVAHAGENPAKTITVNGVSKTILGLDDNLLWDISSVSSIVIQVHSGVWALSGGPYVQFATIRLY